MAVAGTGRPGKIRCWAAFTHRHQLTWVRFLHRGRSRTCDTLLISVLIRMPSCMARAEAWRSTR